MKKTNANKDAIIHIHAKCNYFEIFEHITEKKSFARLQQIRKSYIDMTNHYEIGGGTLTVNTVKVNPTLF